MSFKYRPDSYVGHLLLKFFFFLMSELHYNLSIAESLTHGVTLNLLIWAILFNTSKK